MYPILNHKNIFLKNYAFHFANSTFTNTKKFAFHTHDFYEFTIVEDGILRQLINGKKMELEQYSVCLIQPDDLHAVYCSPKSKNVRVFNIAITSELFNKTRSFLGMKQQQNINFLSHISMEKWSSIYAQLKRIDKDYHTENSQFLEIYIKELIVDLLVILFKKPVQKEQNIPVWLKNAYHEMKEPKNFLIGLPHFIRLADRSQEHLNRSMKKYYSITPTVYINQLRLQFAAFQLSSTEKPITSIIYDSGFENISHFSRLFKKYYDLTPRQYRYKNKIIYNLE